MIANSRVIVLDRDGVINHDSDGYIKSPAEWRPLPGSLEAIARLHDAGYRIIVVSNQSGVARGLFDLATLDRIHAKMRAAVEAAGGAIAGVYFCPHAPDTDCACRKPRTGMLSRAQADLGLGSFTAVPIIGDKITDLELAAAVHARGILVLTGKGARTAAEAATSARQEIYPDLAAAVDALLAEDRS
ncbi:MAG TPA: D-glycero-beta-D-manno-heptose 1,7-bisphosphate 7-phosphatase [Gammaproteobacteria bacterium]|nr:D-glycero-beta-D-manno-heptose 1,7-bisphosphate 7-phosphatase [Gammaproteobacteria bacterium]